jgi:threonyl-tRNA synthetase
MRILGIHSASFHCQARERASDGAERVSPSAHVVESDQECLVLFISVEKDDASSPASVARQLVRDTRQRVEQLGVRRVVVYPYVHLTEHPASPRVARRTLDEITEQLRSDDRLEVLRTPFGWYKSFAVSCLGHPLSEWSARYHPGAGAVAAVPSGKEQQRPESSGFHRYLVADARGRAYEVSPDSFLSCPVFAGGDPAAEHLRQLVSNELAGGEPGNGQPRHIEYMRRHDLLDYCDASEKGHYKWYPKGLLVQRLLLDAAADLARQWGAFEMRNPIVLRGDHNQIGELMGEFHERDYQVDGGRGICYLRYASDPLAFPFLQKVRFSHRQTPLRVYEEASCFRNEQQGEVSGLKRVRSFLMTDMHAACASEEQARVEYEQLCCRFAELMNQVIAPERWVLGWEVVESFFEEQRQWLLGICRRLQVPALFKLMPEMSHYYLLKNEYQVITQDRSNIQVSTVQWDIKDGPRFDIGYTDESGSKVPCPVIIHASSFGSIERALCAMLEGIAIDADAGRPPMLPLWLSPAQVRLLPVSQQHLDHALDVCERLAARRIRADVDDRDATLGRKVREAEQDWVPYLLVIGEREQRSGRFSVRDRARQGQIELDLDELVALVHEGTAGLPYRPIPLPVRLSHRPLFGG